MSHHKKYKTNQKHSKKSNHENLSTNSVIDSIVPKHNKPNPKSHPKPHNNCNCTQLFYTPLPILPYQTCSTTIKMDEWFSPGTVQTCCSICPSINPVDAQSQAYSTNCCYKKH